MADHPDSFGARRTLQVGDRELSYYALDALRDRFDVDRLPFSIKVLLENLLRTEDGATIRADHVEAVAGWDPAAEPSIEIAFTPSRVLLQDFTGVPCVVDLASMRDAMRDRGGDPARVEPLQPVELVIDHSVQVDVFGTANALARNADLEFSRNQERYEFLRWGQGAFGALAVVPPNTGICHQVNLEFLARVVFDADGVAYPDTLVGTDSHTTMINGLGVLGWGVGGIEAEAAMLGQPISMLLPQVVGFRLKGELPEGATATDLVLTITERLRQTGVVGRFVEFFGPGVSSLPLADRATIGNMSPEFGSTCAIFPIDEETLRYLRFTGRSEERVALVEAYAKAQGWWHTADAREPEFSQVVELDLSTVVPSLAGPKRPQDRVALSAAKESFTSSLVDLGAGRQGERGGVATATEMGDGAVVIAAITSCTNTSNPSVMLAAGLVARKAREKGLTVKPWVKTSLAPGSKVVTEYYEQSGLLEDLAALGFDVVGYGCTTCIGNSGPLIDEVARQVEAEDLVVVSVLSGNRNFEGRINQQVKANYLASPPLVVAYALAGRMDLDLTTEPLGQGSDGEDVYLRDVWPTTREVADTLLTAMNPGQYTSTYAAVYEGDDHWRQIAAPEGDHYTWDPDSTYVRKAPFFDLAPGSERIEGARALAWLGDSVTTDHISPAGAIKKSSPAGRWLEEQGVEQGDFNSYGSRRGNHEVMVRGTFANIRIRNKLVPGVEGGVTRVLLDGAGDEPVAIYDAAQAYAAAGVPLVVLAGKEYGSGSSRDWAAKGTRLLGVQAVIAESYERIHRSNLVGMGVLPLQLEDGVTAEGLGLTGTETFAIVRDGRTASVTTDSGIAFTATVRIDTPKEEAYFAAGGILPFVLGELAK